MNLSDALAAEIRRRRTNTGQTVTQAAESTGVPVQTWYSWENGNRSLTVDRLPAVALTLGCSVAALIRGAENLTTGGKSA